MGDFNIIAVRSRRRFGCKTFDFMSGARSGQRWRRDAVERNLAIKSVESTKRPAALIAGGTFSIGHPVKT
jgi:hypothetical protein